MLWELEQTPPHQGKMEMIKKEATRSRAMMARAHNNNNFSMRKNFGAATTGKNGFVDGLFFVNNFHQHGKPPWELYKYQN